MTRPPPGLVIRPEIPEDTDTIFALSQPWFALGPVSVLPAMQGQHIGSALIEGGLQQISQQGALGCILTGNPDYYRRFGFQSAAAHAPAREPEEYFMLKPLLRKPAPGSFEFHPAFYAEGVSL